MHQSGDFLSEMRVSRHPVLAQQVGGHKFIEFFNREILHELPQFGDWWTFPNGCEHIAAIVQRGTSDGNANIECFARYPCRS